MDAVGFDLWTWICVGVLGVGLAALSWIDLRTGYLPFAIQIPLGLCGAAVAVVGSPVSITWQAAAIGALLNAGVFAGLRWLVTRLKGREAMGQGDIWLVLVGGLWLGPWALPLIMAVGGLATLAGAGLVGLVTRKPVWRGEMPLGPGLAAGIFGCYIGALIQVPWIRLTGA
jgi:leader peptidase (prepilin peptidase)/N-methyltransferase